MYDIGATDILLSAKRGVNGLLRKSDEHMSLRRQKQEWEELGNMDPYWAILAQAGRKFGKWDTNEFFATGAQEIARVMESTADLGYPSGREVALDFGCGVGRLTRALAKYFQQCYGVDISESMVAKAKEINRSFPNCSFFVNTEEHLSTFADDCFDLIYTNLVLQHLPRKATIKKQTSAAQKAVCSIEDLGSQ